MPSARDTRLPLDHDRGVPRGEILRREVCAWAWTCLLVLAVVIVATVAAAAVIAVFEGERPTAEFASGLVALLAALRGCASGQ